MATSNSPVTILQPHRNPWTPRTGMKMIEESNFVLRRQDQTSDRWCFWWLPHLHLPSPNDPGKTTVLTNPDLHCSRGTKEPMIQMFPRCVKTPLFSNNVSNFGELFFLIFFLGRSPTKFQRSLKPSWESMGGPACYKRSDKVEFNFRYIFMSNNWQIFVSISFEYFFLKVYIFHFS